MIKIRNECIKKLKKEANKIFNDVEVDDWEEKGNLILNTINLFAVEYMGNDIIKVMQETDIKITQGSTNVMTCNLTSQFLVFLMKYFEERMEELEEDDD